MDVMKNIFVSLFIWGFVIFNSFSCSTSEGYRLTGVIEGVAEGSKVSLTLTGTHRDEKQEVETTVKDGRFVLTGQLPEPRLYLLSIEEPTGASGNYVLMLEIVISLSLLKKGNSRMKSFCCLNKCGLRDRQQMICIGRKWRLKINWGRCIMIIMQKMPRSVNRSWKLGKTMMVTLCPN